MIATIITRFSRGWGASRAASTALQASAGGASWTPRWSAAFSSSSPSGSVAVSPSPADASSSSPIADALHLRVQEGALRQDREQLHAAAVLDKLLAVAEARRKRALLLAEAADTDAEERPAAEEGDAEKRVAHHQHQHNQHQHQLPAVCGAYLWGSVGTGKTMMMDMFAAELRRRGVPVRRAHFHGFMLDVHAKLHAFQQAIPVATVQSLKGQLVHRQLVQPDQDPIEAVAEVVRRADDGQAGGEPAQFLCFDELHVADVADAMILSRLMRHIVSKGTLVMFTSNQHPSALYKGGLSRDFFLPFVDLVLSRTAVLGFGGAVDYRRVRRGPAPAGAGPGGAGPEPPAGQWLSAPQQEELLWRLECGPDAPQPAAMLPVGFGRSLRVPLSVRAGGAALGSSAAAAARFSFEDLCGSRGLHAGKGQGGALGPNDYAALARSFPTLHVTGIPALGPALRDEARRWVVLLDCLYEAGTRLVCQADCGVEEMFRDIRAEAQKALDSNAGGGAEEGTLEASHVGLLREELLMYQRAESRLVEMCDAQG